jgi:transposase
MIPIPSDVRVWLAVGRTDMRRGMNGLALQVQEALVSLGSRRVQGLTTGRVHWRDLGIACD